MILRLDRLLIDLLKTKAPAGEVWYGPHPEDDQPLSFEHLPKDHGGAAAQRPHGPDHLADILNRLG